MPIFQQIALEAVEILTLIFGIFGITFSLLLIFSPGLTKSVSTVFIKMFRWIHSSMVTMLFLASV